MARHRRGGGGAAAGVDAGFVDNFDSHTTGLSPPHAGASFAPATSSLTGMTPPVDLSPSKSRRTQQSHAPPRSRPPPPTTASAAAGAAVSSGGVASHAGHADAASAADAGNSRGVGADIHAPTSRGFRGLRSKPHTVWVPGKFRHNVRLWLQCTPALFVTCAFGGRLMNGTLVLGLMLTYLLDAGDSYEATLVSFVGTMIVTGITLIVSMASVLGEAWNAWLLLLCMLTLGVCAGIWGALQLSWLYAEDPFMCRRLEAALFAAVGPATSVVAAWGAAAVLGASALPMLVAIGLSASAVLVGVPLRTSFPLDGEARVRVSGAASDSDPDSDDEEGGSDDDAAAQDGSGEAERRRVRGGMPLLLPARIACVPFMLALAVPPVLYFAALPRLLDGFTVDALTDIASLAAVPLGSTWLARRRRPLWWAGLTRGGQKRVLTVFGVTGAIMGAVGAEWRVIMPRYWHAFALSRPVSDVVLAATLATLVGGVLQAAGGASDAREGTANRAALVQLAAAGVGVWVLFGMPVPMLAVLVAMGYSAGCVMLYRRLVDYAVLVLCTALSMAWQAWRGYSFLTFHFQAPHLIVGRRGGTMPLSLVSLMLVALATLVMLAPGLVLASPEPAGAAALVSAGRSRARVGVAHDARANPARALLGAILGAYAWGSAFLEAALYHTAPPHASPDGALVFPSWAVLATSGMGLLLAWRLGVAGRIGPWATYFLSVVSVSKLSALLPPIGRAAVSATSLQAWHRIAMPFLGVRLSVPSPLPVPPAALALAAMTLSPLLIARVPGRRHRSVTGRVLYAAAVASAALWARRTVFGAAYRLFVGGHAAESLMLGLAGVVVCVTLAVAEVRDGGSIGTAGVGSASHHAARVRGQGVAATARILVSVLLVSALVAIVQPSLDTRAFGDDPLVRWAVVAAFALPIAGEAFATATGPGSRASTAAASATVGATSGFAGARRAWVFSVRVATFTCSAAVLAACAAAVALPRNALAAAPTAFAGESYKYGMGSSGIAAGAGMMAAATSGSGSGVPLAALPALLPVLYGVVGACAGLCASVISFTPPAVAVEVARARVSSARATVSAHARALQVLPIAYAITVSVVPVIATVQHQTYGSATAGLASDSAAAASTFLLSCVAVAFGAIATVARLVGHAFASSGDDDDHSSRRSRIDGGAGRRGAADHDASVGWVLRVGNLSALVTYAATVGLSALLYGAPAGSACLTAPLMLLWQPTSARQAEHWNPYYPVVVVLSLTLVASALNAILLRGMQVSWQLVAAPGDVQEVDIAFGLSTGVWTPAKNLVLIIACVPSLLSSCHFLRTLSRADTTAMMLWAPLCVGAAVLGDAPVVRWVGGTAALLATASVFLARTAHRAGAGYI